jgi:hypothetical protein
LYFGLEKKLRHWGRYLGVHRMEGRTQRDVLKLLHETDEMYELLEASAHAVDFARSVPEYRMVA